MCAVLCVALAVVAVRRWKQRTEELMVKLAIWWGDSERSLEKLEEERSDEAEDERRAGT